MGSIYRLAEHFISINGEGRSAGELALFLRFAGCNLRCDWCDTAWACGKNAPCDRVSLQHLVRIAEEALKQGVRRVTLTGGEPLLQEGISDVIRGLGRLGLLVEIETNGAVPLGDFVQTGAAFTMDYKLPSSRMEQHMCTENFALLNADFDCVKFVCGSRQDVFRAKQIAEQYRPPCPMYLSPVFGRIEPAEIVELMKEEQMSDFRLQLQLHKFIWPPDARGV